MTQLTPQQTKRIEEEAKEFANNRTTDSQAYKIGAQVGYVYGASAEALRGKELVDTIKDLLVIEMYLPFPISDRLKQALKNYNL